jgi:polysaccharide deacetylase 2 family uncharacterized protein YibQ
MQKKLKQLQKKRNQFLLDDETISISLNETILFTDINEVIAFC